MAYVICKKLFSVFWVCFVESVAVEWVAPLYELITDVSRCFELYKYIL